MDPAAFLNQFVSEFLAGSPSFEVGGQGGDARRSRRGLSPSDVRRLIEENPDFGDQIRKMYTPGPMLPNLPQAGYSVSPKNAETLATLEYFGNGQLVNNPAVVRQAINTRASDILRNPYI